MEAPLPFKPSLFRTLTGASNQYSTNLYTSKTHHVLSSPSTTVDVTSVSLLESSSSVPVVFGAQAWLPAAADRDAEYTVKLYSNANQSLVNALRVMPAHAVFAGTIATQGVFVRDWLLLQDSLTGDLLVQKRNGSGQYETKARFSSSP